jgi:hypothetical protein
VAVDVLGQPAFVFFKNQKEGEVVVRGVEYCYGRFLSTSTASRAPITTIATIMTIDIGRK